MRKRAILFPMVFFVHVLVMSLAANVFAETVFAPRVDYPTTNPFFLAAGDLNNDANQDLVVANWLENTVTVFLGGGDGTFTAQSPVTVGVHPNSIVTGFMNDDPHLDLAVASGGGIRDVTLLLGDGSGGFSSVSSIDVTNNGDYSNGDADINYLISGDFDGDGETDLALAKNSGYLEVNDHIKIMRGDGAGGFTPLSSTAVGDSASGPFGLASGNFNGDGYPDLAVAMFDSGTIKVFLGSGGGAFTEAVGSPVTVGAGPLRVVTADLDNNGAADLAVSNNGNNTITVLLGNGDGTFNAAPGSPLAAGASPVGLTTALMDQDGSPDIVVTNGGASTFSLFAGNGDGTFQPRQDYGTGAGPISLVSDDFDQDGLPDVAVANSSGNTVSIFLQTQCAPPPFALLSWWAGDGNAADLIGGNGGTLFNGAGYAGGMVGEAFSFDGVDDYVDLPAAASTRLNNEAGSISAWVRPSAVGNNDMIAVFGSGADGQGVGLGIWGNVRIYHHTATYDWQTTTPVAAGEWTHLTYTWDATTERLYKNGVFSESRPRNFSYVPGAGRIGDGFWGDPANPFPGLIDEVQTYGRTLSDEEIASLYRAGSSGICRPCAAQHPQALSWWQGEGNPADYYGLNNATQVNGAGYGPGRVGEAFLLDGTDDFVQVQVPTGLPVGNEPRTMDLWFKTPRNLVATQEGALVQYGSTGGGSQMFGLIFSGNCSGKLYFYGHGDDLCGTTTVQPDTWYHGAVTFDGATLNLYLNGRLEASKSTTLNTVLDGNGLTIGYRSPDSRWQGELDEVRVHTSALSASEIEDIYNAREAGVCGSCVEPPAGMVNWWGGDGNGVDMQGTDDGTLVGNTTYGAGLVGQAFSFDGAGDYVQMADVATGDFGAGPFTLDFWLHANVMDAGANYYLLGKSHPDGGQGWDLRLQDSRINIVGVNGWPAQYNFRTEPIINTGQWHHAAMVSDGITVELYVDGQLTGSIPRQAISTASNPFRLGFTTNYGGAAFNGLLDEVEIFDRALTSVEVRAIFTAGREGKCRTCAAQPAGAVSLWKAESNTDDSIGANTGTLSNGATYAAGRVGQAFSFDGVDDYVFVPDTLTIDGGTQASYAAWVYPEAAPAVDQYSTVLAVGDATLPTWTTEQCRLLYWRTADSPAATAKFYTDCGTNDAEESYLARFSAQSYPINAWHSVVVVFNNGELDMYVNGVLDNGAGTNIGGPAAINTGAYNYVAMGAAVRSDQSLLSSPFHGRIDEVEIFSQALSVSEIQDMYNAREAGVCIAYTVSASVGFGGSLDAGTPSPQFVAEGATVEFTFNADTGFHVAEVSGCGVSYTNTSNAVSSYTATTGAITGNCEISATFAGNQYTATASAGTGGSLDPGTPSPQTVVAGTTVEFTFNADPGYHLSSIVGCGITIENDTVTSRTITTAPITEDCTVNATFAINQYTVSAAAGTNGSLDAGTPSPQTVDHGSTAQFTFNAATGYHMAGISGCGINYSNSDNAVSSRTETTAAVTGDCTVNATFAINLYTVSSSAGAGGSISPSGAVAVNHGSDQSFTVIPDANYHVADVLVDGGSVGAVTSYTFINVTAEHTIAASFAFDQHTLAVSLAGSGQGTVNSSPVGIDCGTDCSETFDAGTVVTLTATAEEGSQFAGWTGDADCGDGTVTMTEDVSCTATFRAYFPWILFNHIFTGAGQ